MRSDPQPPENWKSVKLGDIATILMGQSPPGANVNGKTSGMPFLQGNAEFGDRYPKAIHWCDPPGRIARKGNLLLSVRAPVGEMNEADQDYTIERGLAAIDVPTPDKEFLWHAILYGRDQLEHVSQGSTFDAINKDELSNLNLFLPPTDERRLIGNILQSIDDVIAATQAVIEQTRQLKTALLQDLLFNGLPGRHQEHQRDRSLGRLPASWRVQPLGQLCTLAIDGPFGSNLKTNHYTESGVRVVRLQNVGIGEFTDQDKAYVSLEHFVRLKRYEAKTGDLLVASMGDETWPVGRCCQMPEGVQPAMIKADCFRFRVNSILADNLFIKWYLNAPLARRVINRGSHGQTRIRLNLANAKRIPTPVPPIEEQKSIGQVIQAIHDRGTEEESRLEQLLELKAALSQGLLTGQISVRGRGDTT